MLENYSEMLDMLSKSMNKNVIRIPFPIDGKIGELNEATIAFRIVSQDLGSAQIQLLDFKLEKEAPAETPKVSGVIPSPS